MFKTLTAGLTALSLTLIPASPVQAQNNNDDLNRAIIGLLAVGAIGLAIKNNQSQSSETRSNRASVQVHKPNRNHGNNNNRVREQRRVDPVPGRCFRRIETARGNFQGVFTERCLERRYRDASTLPRQCRVGLGGNNGNRRGYEANCLRDFGYRSDRRWN